VEEGKMTDQPRLTENDIKFRALELRSMTNAALARAMNEATKGATYWTGVAVGEEGRDVFIRSILRLEGFSALEIQAYAEKVKTW
jgi:hypothetical protein